MRVVAKTRDQIRHDCSATASSTIAMDCEELP